MATEGGGDAGTLAGKSVAILVEYNFEDSELTQPKFSRRPSSTFPHQPHVLHRCCLRKCPRRLQVRQRGVVPPPPQRAPTVCQGAAEVLRGQASLPRHARRQRVHGCRDWGSGEQWGCEDER